MGHNFAYFVYDGTPDWSGSVRRNGSKITFPGSLMSSIPTYFLLTKASSVTGSQFGGYGGAEYKWKGTMVYDGKVYDHIRYRPRGGVHRYQYGKNFWKFDFNRGRRFQARDRGGNKYKTKWDKLNFSSIVQQVNFGHRGEQGLFESVGFKLFELCGVEACKTHYLQFYVLMMKVRPDPISTVLTTMVFILPSNKWTDSSWIKMECLTAIFIKLKVTPAPQTIRDQPKSQTDLMSPTSSEVIEIKTPALTGGVKISTLINTLATESSSRVSTTTTSLTVRITIITTTLKLINFRYTLGTLT